MEQKDDLERLTTGSGNPTILTIPTQYRSHHTHIRSQNGHLRTSHDWTRALILFIFGLALVCVGLIWFNLDQFYLNLNQEARLNSLAGNYNELNRQFLGNGYERSQGSDPQLPRAGHWDRLDSPGQSNQRNGKTLDSAQNPFGQSTGIRTNSDEIVRPVASPPPDSASRKLPGSIIIGARKCGTRALLEFLNLHPNIRTARYEVHFFDQNETYAKGLDWYRERMPLSHAGQLTIEKTPAYFTNPLTPERVFHMNSSVRILLILRNPLIRTISDYTQVHYTKLSKNKTHEPFEKLVFRSTGELNLDYKPVRNSLYVKHLRRWLRYFPLENIHFIDGDQFIKDPVPELEKIEDFLGLDTKITREQLYFNATKGFYCYRMRHGGVPKCLGDSKGRPHVSVDQGTMARLGELLRPFNEKFFSLINRRFDW